MGGLHDGGEEAVGGCVGGERISGLGDSRVPASSLVLIQGFGDARRC